MLQPEFWWELAGEIIFLQFYSLFIGSLLKLMTKLHHILKISSLDIFPTECFALRLLVPRVSKSRTGGRTFSYQAPLCGASCQFGFRKQTPSLPLRLGLKLSFFTKFIVRGGSGDLETSHSYAAIGLDCWGTSHDAPLLSRFSFLSMFIWHY